MCMKSNFNLLFYVVFHLHFNANTASFLRLALSARTLYHSGFVMSNPQAQTMQMVN